MKIVVALACLLLTACGQMDYEEYAKRVSYCKELGMTSYTYEPVLGVKGQVGKVVCKTQDGAQSFDSKVK